MAHAQKPLARFWCFTLNNPDGQLDVDLAHPNVRYAVWQLEVGDSGTEHFQGYLELKRTQRLSYLKKLIPGAHFEIRKKTAEQARDYCMKPEGRIEGPFELGQFERAQGRRNDLLDVKAKLDLGASEATIAEENFESWCKYARAFKDYKRLKTPQRDWKTEVTYIYGPPGSGKSRKAKEDLPGAHWVDPPKDKQGSIWWTDYDSKENVVIDDFYAWLPFHFLLRLMDRYPMTVENKGNSYQFVAKKLYITSNHLPCNLYKPCHPLMALTRRIEHFVVFDENGNHDVYNDYDSFVIATAQFNRHSE
ncbi:replication-associated protein [Amazon milk frog associated circular DNA virus]|nr:replication-associated protein [Amazon milk frog associated circular DNA virus]